MLTPSALEACCAAKPGAVRQTPFGPVPVCYKVGGKVFAQIYPYAGDYKVTLKCSPDESALFRSLYPQAVVRGYHCPPVQQPYWNTVYVERINEGVLLDMIDIAYRRVIEKLPQKVRKSLFPEGVLP